MGVMVEKEVGVGFEWVEGDWGLWERLGICSNGQGCKNRMVLVRAGGVHGPGRRRGWLRAETVHAAAICDGASVDGLRDAAGGDGGRRVVAADVNENFSQEHDDVRF
ncbi:hypothetical protein PIB30_016326 [Stylosanthes scabra]|uniref:Uncharacterized protein n=1 Tax=Stylosanthes scabra TaxID=79078 RepID=A0ABU6R7N6_9FABA|nr:hypothetical protein [Stylosanthes scabra]